MQEDYQLCGLEDFGALRVQGADAVRFLQAQLSNDVQRLAPQCSVLAGYHNPQGRVIALMRLVHLGADDVLAILPRELAAPVAQRLGKFLLRAKATVTDASAQWRIGGLIREERAGPSAGSSALPLSVGAQQRVGDAILVCVGEQPARLLEISPHTAPRRPKGPDSAVTASRERWRELDVRAGLPQVYAATSEQFVAQMLNLDVIGAIAFDKGCYTGQEVIARAHYRGRVKRRLQRFRSRGALGLAPADSGSLPDGRSFTVIEAAQLADGRCEFLAVARLPGAQPESAAAEAGKPVDAEPLDLPYSLPE